MTELGYTPLPFDDTYVLFNPSDPVSFASVYFTLLPIGILVFYLSWFIITREIEPVILTGGQVVNDIINNLVKYIIKEERPYIFEHFQESGIRSNYGMPSAHSQFMGYFATYLTLRVWLQWNGLTSTRKVLSTLALYTAAFGVIFSRVYLNYHSWNQVLVGFTIGSAIGATYFLIISIARGLGVIDYLLSFKVLKLFWIKDSVYHSPLSLEEEYNLWLHRRSITKDEKHK